MAAEGQLEHEASTPPPTTSSSTSPPSTSTSANKNHQPHQPPTPICWQDWAPHRQRQGLSHLYSNFSSVVWRPFSLTLLHDGTLYLSDASRTELSRKARGSSPAAQAGAHCTHPPSSAPWQKHTAGKRPPAYCAAARAFQARSSHSHPSTLSGAYTLHPAPGPKRADETQGDAPDAARLLPLQGALCVPCPQIRGRRQWNTFVIQTRSRDHYFRCRGAEEAKHWVSVTNEAIAIAEARGHAG